MDKMLIRKDVYKELLEKGFGKKDYSKLTKKVITDKNGHRRTVFVKNGEQPAEVKQPKAQEGITPEKKAKYEEMLEKVKAGSDENALFVRGEMLNKKDAIDYLEKKLGRKNGVVAEQKMKMEDEKKDAAMKDQGTKSSEQMLDEKAKENFKKDARKMSDKGLEQKIKNLTTPGSLDYQVYSNPEQIAKVFEEELNRRKAEKNSSAEGHLESDTPQNTDITKEDEERFGKQALSGLSGKRTSDEEMEDSEEKNKVSFEDSVKEYNFTDTKKTQFAMNEVANFYPELKDIVENRRKAFSEVNDAEKKLKINPNNKEYKDNFASAYNKLKQADAEYDKASKKALEKAPNIAKPDFSKYMNAKRDVQKFLDKYKQQSEEYEVGKRLRENGGSSILSPMYGLKPDDYTKDPDYINAQMIIRAYEGK